MEYIFHPAHFPSHLEWNIESSLACPTPSRISIPIAPALLKPIQNGMYLPATPVLPKRNTYSSLAYLLQTEYIFQPHLRSPGGISIPVSSRMEYLFRPRLPDSKRNISSGCTCPAQTEYLFRLHLFHPNGIFILTPPPPLQTKYFILARPKQGSKYLGMEYLFQPKPAHSK